MSCYDRVLITGTLPGMRRGMTRYLHARGIRIFDYPQFAMTLRDRVRNRCSIAGCRGGDRHRAHRQGAYPQGRRCCKGAVAERRSPRAGAHHLGDGSLRRLPTLARQASGEQHGLHDLSLLRGGALAFVTREGGLAGGGIETLAAQFMEASAASSSAAAQPLQTCCPAFARLRRSGRSDLGLRHLRDARCLRRQAAPGARSKDGVLECSCVTASRAGRPLSRERLLVSPTCLSPHSLQEPPGTGTDQSTTVTLCH